MSDTYPKWRIEHRNPRGGLYGGSIPQYMDASNSSITSLERIELDQHGDSLDASFTGLVSLLAIKPLDILTIEVQPNNGGIWQKIYVGQVVIAGVPRSTQNSTVQLSGLSNRLYQVSPEANQYGVETTGTDIGVIAALIVKDVIDSGRVGNAFVYDPASFPVIGAEIDVINVQAASVGDLLDLLAGSFDNLTWGVAPDRKIFLKTISSSSNTLSEDSNTSVTWKEGGSEGVVNTIDFFVPIPKLDDMAKYTARNEASIALYDERRATANVPTEYNLVKPVTVELEYFLANPGGGNFGAGGAAIGSLVPANQIYILKDGKAATTDEFVRMAKSSFSFSGLDEFVLIVSSPDSAAMEKVGLVVVRAAGSVGGVGGGTSQVTLDLLKPGAPTQLGKRVTRIENYDPSANRPYNIPFGAYQVPSGPGLNSVWLRMTVQTVAGAPGFVGFDLKVWEMRPYEFDYPVLDKIALTLYRDPPIDPGTIRTNRLIPPRPVLNLNSDTYGALSPSPKLFSYMFTAGEYATTKIELESAYDAQSTNRKKITNETDGAIQARSSSQANVLTSRNNPLQSGKNTGVYKYKLLLSDNATTTNTFAAPTEWAHQRILFIVSSIIIRNAGVGVIQSFVGQFNGVVFITHPTAHINSLSGSADFSLGGSCIVDSWEPTYDAVNVALSGLAGGSTDPQEVYLTAIIL